MILPSPLPTVIFQRLADGAVLFAPEIEIYFGLNDVGARVWELLPPASRSLDELCARLAMQYPDAPSAEIRRDVAELLEQLASEGLVVSSSTGPDDLEAR